jgi:replicative DNA helicase
MKIEQMILRNLIHNEEYFRKVLPFLKSEYFSDRTEKIIFDEIEKFTHQYNSPPTANAIDLAVREGKNLTENDVRSCEDYLGSISESKEEKPKLQWLIDKTEKFCQEKAVYNAVLGSISILDGKDKTLEKGSIPKLLSDALSVSFDNSIGHDYLEDADSRYEFYHRKEERIPFDLDYFNKITKGGLPKKTLNIALAGTGVGKSLFMCHVAAGAMSQGYNALYITLEMAEEKIAERIDANLLNVTVDELSTLSKELYDRKVKRVKEMTTGKLIIKEYPTASASSVHFRTLLNELELKRNFIPDIIFIDYLNICCSSRIKAGASVNSYTYVKAIAEELRGLAVEFNVPIVSATQTTRGGFTSSDPGLEDTSESFGLPATADLMFAIISSEELESLNQLMIKQLKNRYNDPTMHKRFVVGVDRAKMKLYDVEQSAQQGLADAGNTQTMQQSFSKSNKRAFETFKV